MFDAKKIIKNFIKHQKRSKIMTISHGEKKGALSNPEESHRFLIELEFPTVEVQFKDQTFKKNLNEDDLRYLAVSNFKQWSNFVMTRHFRLELNIGAEQPLPKIMEDKRGEDGDLLSE